jgi:DNA-binding NtrC family response regulator
MSPRTEASIAATEPAAGRVLLVDDQPELRRLFRRSLAKAGFEVVEAADGEIAIELAQQLRFDVVVSDISMPDVGGIELLNALRELDPDLPVVLTSGSLEPDDDIDATELGAYAYLLKPVAFETMRETARQAVALRRARASAAGSEPNASVERLKVPDSDPEAG